MANTVKFIKIDDHSYKLPVSIIASSLLYECNDDIDILAVYESIVSTFAKYYHWKQEKVSDINAIIYRSDLCVFAKSGSLVFYKLPVEIANFTEYTIINLFRKTCISEYIKALIKSLAEFYKWEIVEEKEDKKE